MRLYTFFMTESLISPRIYMPAGVCLRRPPMRGVWMLGKCPILLRYGMPRGRRFQAGLSGPRLDRSIVRRFMPPEPLCS